MSSPIRIRLGSLLVALGLPGLAWAGGVVRVPEEVGFLVMLPLTRSPSPADSSCRFDNLGLYRMIR
jgi:hypothetical protein